MNERNTNRSRRTPNSRTTQRHQIDGRPAPRRQASQPDYLHGSPQSAPRSQHQHRRSADKVGNAAAFLRIAVAHISARALAGIERLV